MHQSPMRYTVCACCLADLENLDGILNLSGVGKLTLTFRSERVGSQRLVKYLNDSRVRRIVYWPKLRLQTVTRSSFS